MGSAWSFLWLPPIFVRIYAAVTTDFLPQAVALLLRLRIRPDNTVPPQEPQPYPQSISSLPKSTLSFDGKKKYTLILDLDETLVHTTRWAGKGNADCRLEIFNNRDCRAFFVYKRPYLTEFLSLISNYYEIVIFTASVRHYADPLIDILDPHRCVRRRYFRSSCIDRNGSFVKDLSRVTSKLESTVIIDNSPVAYSMNKDNAIPIKPYYDDPSDNELLTCIPFLIALRSMEDVRFLLRRRAAKS